MYRKTLQTSVAAAALFAFAAAYSAPASAGGDDTFKSGTKASLKLSGQVSRAVMYVDDGNESEVFHVDGDNTSTRWRLQGTGKVTDKFTVSMRLETQIESNASNSVTMAGSRSTISAGGFSERYADVALAYKGLGKLYLGQGDPASNGTAEISLSGLSVAQYVDAKVWGGGILFTDSATGAASSRSAGSAWNHHDGNSRIDRIRYDTPKFAGFMLGASHMQGDLWDIALKHAGKFGQFKTKAAIAYVDFSQTSATVDDQIDGSFSVLHDSGLNITVSAGKSDLKSATRNDDDHIYVQLGYIAKLTDVGTTRFGISWGNANDVGANDDDYTVWSLAVNQNLKAVGADIYAVWRNHDLDATGENLDDINVFVIGSRVKF